MLQNAGVLYILTCKCASRHSGVWVLDIWPSKSGPNMWCFKHFYLQMCFAPQLRAILPDRNFQNCSRTEVFCAIWLANVLRATAACHFSTSQRQKVLRPWGVLCILTEQCGFRHSGVPFFTCLLNSYLRTRRSSEATFGTSGRTNHWKNRAILGVASISRTCTCFLLTLHACWSPFCWLDTSAFQLCILSEVRLLNFLR